MFQLDFSVLNPLGGVIACALVYAAHKHGTSPEQKAMKAIEASRNAEIGRRIKQGLKECEAKREAEKERLHQLDKYYAQLYGPVVKAAGKCTLVSLNGVSIKINLGAIHTAKMAMLAKKEVILLQEIAIWHCSNNTTNNPHWDLLLNEFTNCIFTIERLIIDFEIAGT